MLKTIGPCPSRRALRIEPETSLCIAAYLVLIWISNKLLLGLPFFQPCGFPMAPSMSAKQRHNDCRMSSNGVIWDRRGSGTSASPLTCMRLWADACWQKR